MEAKQLLQESVAIFREMGDDWGLSNALNRLAQTNYAAGNDQAAWEQLREALQITHKNQIPPVTLDVLVSLADLWLQTASKQPAFSQGQAAALDLLILALNHPASQQVTRDRAARLLTKFETNLSRPAIEAAQSRVQIERLEAIIAKIIA